MSLLREQARRGGNRHAALHPESVARQAGTSDLRTCPMSLECESSTCSVDVLASMLTFCQFSGTISAMTKPLLPDSKRHRLARSVGQRIRAFRIERGFSPSDLAVLVEVQVGRIKAYESGDALPPLYTLLRLSRTLRTSTDSLLGDEYVMPMNSQAVIDVFRELSSLPLPIQLPIASFLRQLLGWLKGTQGR